MRKIRNLFRRFKTMHETAPYLVISRPGQATPNPSVNLGLHSTRGAIGLMTRPDTNPGHAHIEMHARTMARISCLPLLDARDPDDRKQIVVG